MKLKFKEGTLLANNFNSIIDRLEEDVTPLLEEKYKSLLKFIINMLKDKNTNYILYNRVFDHYTCSFSFKSHEFSLFFDENFKVTTICAYDTSPILPCPILYFDIEYYGNKFISGVYNDGYGKRYKIEFNPETKEKRIT